MLWRYKTFVSWYYDFYPLLKVYFFDFFSHFPGASLEYGAQGLDFNNWEDYNKYFKFFGRNLDGVTVEDLDFQMFNHKVLPLGAEFASDNYYILFSDLRKH